MFLLFIFVFLSHLIVFCSEKKSFLEHFQPIECIHDLISEEKVIQSKQSYKEESRRNNKEFENIRITYDFSSLFEFVSEGVVENGTKKAVEIAHKRIENLFRVIPIEGNLYPSIDTCGSITVSEDYKNNGIEETDLLIYLEGEECSDSAYAGACEVDQYGRVIVGRIVLCDEYVEELAKRSGEYKDMYEYYDSMVMVHETFHILGVSRWRYDDYIDRSTGEKYTESVLQTFFENGYNVAKIVTPNSLMQAREHYGCQTLNGIETEFEYPSHVSYRLMFADIMSGGRYWWRPKISNITLALLYDSGWYEINWSENFSGKYLFGYGAGCEFATERCLEPGDPPTLNKGATLGTWCSAKQVDENEWYCSHDRTERVYCGSDVDTGKDIPEQFQYWTSDTKMGGKEKGLFCPFFFPKSLNYKIAYCQYDDQNFRGSNYWGEITGINSYCLESNLMLEGKSYESYGYNMSNKKGLCYNISLLDNMEKTTIEIGVKNENTQEIQYVYCSEDDTGKEISVDGFEGSILCPSLDLLVLQIKEGKNLLDKSDLIDNNDENDDNDDKNDNDDDISIGFNNFLLISTVIIALFLLI